MRAFGLLFVCAVGACGPSPPPHGNAIKAPTPPPLPAPAPRARTATILLNLDALRGGARTKRAVDVASAFLPEGERADAIAWLAVDGASPLREPTKSVVFVQPRAGTMRILRGSESDTALPVVPHPPSSRELVRIQVFAPRAVVRVPHFEPAETVEELTVVVDERPDGGADLHLRERCTNATEAAHAATSLDETIERWNGSGIGIVTGGLFADAKATTDGADARLDIVASPDQVATIAELAASVIHRPR